MSKHSRPHLRLVSPGAEGHALEQRGRDEPLPVAEALAELHDTPEIADLVGRLEGYESFEAFVAYLRTRCDQQRQAGVPENEISTELSGLVRELKQVIVQYLVGCRAIAEQTGEADHLAPVIPLFPDRAAGKASTVFGPVAAGLVTRDAGSTTPRSPTS